MRYTDTKAPPPLGKRGPRPLYPFEGIEAGTGRIVTVDNPRSARVAFHNWCKRHGWTYRTATDGNTVTFYRIT